jgi:hypothetical protein
MAALRIGGEAVAEAIHERQVPLDRLSRKLKGVVARASEVVLVGESGGRAAVLGALPEPSTTADEVETFVRSLLKLGAIDFEGGPKKAKRRGAVAVAAPAGDVNPVTHTIKTVSGKKVLTRFRYACRGCGPIARRLFTGR